MFMERIVINCRDGNTSQIQSFRADSRRYPGSAQAFHCAIHLEEPPHIQRVPSQLEIGVKEVVSKLE